jgi:hypothetical protein
LLGCVQASSGTTSSTLHGAVDMTL